MQWYLIRGDYRMNYLEINEDNTYTLTENTSCLSVYKVYKLSDIAIEDVESNQTTHVRRVTFRRSRSDSVIMYAYIGSGYIKYISNSARVSWKKYDGDTWQMGTENICLYLDNNEQITLENILIVECVYGVVESEDTSFGFEIFDEYNKLIFKINDNVVRTECIKEVTSGKRPYASTKDYEINKDIFVEVDSGRTLIVQENFNHALNSKEWRSLIYSFIGIKQSRTTCELCIVQDGQLWANGTTYATAPASFYMPLNVFSVSDTCIENSW